VDGGSAFDPNHDHPEDTARVLATGIDAGSAALCVAGSAHAVTSHGCTATRLQPMFHHAHSAGNKVTACARRASIVSSSRAALD